MADEGIGVRVLDELNKRGLSQAVDLFDAGTGFFSIVSELEGYEKLILIDAVWGGKPVGTIYRFEFEDLRDMEENDGFYTVHDIGVLQSLRIHGMTGRIPDEIVLYGVQPGSVELSMEIHPKLEPAVGRLADLVVAEIKKDQQTRRKGNGSQYPKAGQRAC